ncbi:MAG: hypothetical protein CL678_15340 [Bdellovibrionaceae bacterium]|nr:hypothetical protein [Pseudobdellovibrionaceae bacterium]
MANIVLLREDRFSGTPALILNQGGKSSAPNSQDAIRRPLVGTELKDAKYASMRVVSSSGLSKKVFNTSAEQEDGSSTFLSDYYTNFIIQSVSETRQEKHQTIETFGEDYVYFFGERPVSITMSAVLLDTNDFRWHQEWWENYNTFLRGTTLVRRDARAYIEVEDVMYEGYIIQASTNRAADSHNQIGLNFTIWLSNKIYLRPLTNKRSVPIIPQTSPEVQAANSSSDPIALNNLSNNNVFAAALSARDGKPSDGGFVSLQNALDRSFVPKLESGNAPADVIKSKIDYINKVATLFKTETFYKSSPEEYVSRATYKVSNSTAQVAKTENRDTLEVHNENLRKEVIEQVADSTSLRNTPPTDVKKYLSFTQLYLPEIPGLMDLGFGYGRTASNNSESTATQNVSEPGTFAGSGRATSRGSSNQELSESEGLINAWSSPYGPLKVYESSNLITPETLFLNPRSGVLVTDPITAATATTNHIDNLNVNKEVIQEPSKWTTHRSMTLHSVSGYDQIYGNTQVQDSGMLGLDSSQLSPSLDSVESAESVSYKAFNIVEYKPETILE